MASLAALTLLLVVGLSAAEVFNTSPADIEDFPSVVQVELGTGPVWVQVCAGTILTNYHVLTAAHCFPRSSSRFRRVRAGATLRGRGGEVYPIQSVTNHPDFTGRSFEADISILRLSTFLNFGSTIQSSPIVASGVEIPANVQVTFAGWGRTAQDTIWADRQLNSADLRTTGHSYCVTQYESLPISVNITDDMICLSEPRLLGTNIGIRDTGAPIFNNDVLIGVVTFGSPIGESYPLVATSVSSFSQWIIATAV